MVVQVAVDILKRPFMAIEPVDEDRSACAVDEIHQKGFLLHHRGGGNLPLGEKGNALVDFVGEDGKQLYEKIRLVF